MRWKRPSRAKRRAKLGEVRVKLAGLAGEVVVIGRSVDCGVESVREFRWLLPEAPDLPESLLARRELAIDRLIRALIAREGLGRSRLIAQPAGDPRQVIFLVVNHDAEGAPRRGWRTARLQLGEKSAVHPALEDLREGEHLQQRSRSAGVLQIEGLVGAEDADVGEVQLGDRFGPELRVLRLLRAMPDEPLV